MIDVAIVGAGPAGLISAREAAKEGAEVTVFEEHGEIGEPERCAGLLSVRGLERLSLEISRSFLQNVVRGACFITESGRRYFFDVGRPVAVVVSRRRFDQALGGQAEKRGAKIFLKTRVKRVTKGGGYFVIETNRGAFKARWVIDAEGAGASILRRFLGMGVESGRWIPIRQLLVEGHNLDRRYVYIYFKSYLPHFFAYLIPIDEDLGKLGAASRVPDLKERLRRFIGEEFPEVRVLEEFGYVIYTGFPLSMLGIERGFVPVGDAAGHVKATTGGGVILGGLIAGSVGRAVAEILRGGDPSEPLGMARAILGELKRIALGRRILEKIPRASYDIFLEGLSRKPLKNYLTRFWDMDFQLSALLPGRRSLYYGLRP